MSIYRHLTGTASSGISSGNLALVQELFTKDEEILCSYSFTRDSIVFTNYGLYHIDFQGVTGKKQLIRFYPKASILSVFIETAGNFELEIEITIQLKGNIVFNENGIPYNQPLKFNAMQKDYKDIIKVLETLK